ncbi:putative methyltransferase chloroplastic-like [Gossypium australe]|uniref:Putative methyltransferase chloroplastic-like n=1 Tax=Gossypium australe TaxID=47621 RepID=A0A5B6XBE9_9ROSI|nr:putative methyltransferase chloroplastic-like [Gossypium australe]
MVADVSAANTIGILNTNRRPYYIALPKAPNFCINHISGESVSQPFHFPFSLMAIAPPSLRPLHKSLFPKYPSFSHDSQFRPSLHFSSRPFRLTVRASSAVALEQDLRTQATQQNQTVETGLDAIYRSGFKCKKCNKSYSSKDVFLDLTVTAGLRNYTEVKPVRTELFRSPLVSFLYERGWRQNFNLSGFPGADEEFRMAQEYFKPAEGGTLVDVSCGSGLFSRKFAKSGTYSGVIALDFSENMLRQCNDFIKQDASLLASNIALVRADVSRLPFSSGSIDAVHAGAALHCWPSPSNAIAEISRILRSGGVFVGSTFLRYTSSTPWIIRPFRERVMQGYNYLTEEEIEEVCTNSGLTNFLKKVQRSFIMFSAQKP